MNIKYLKPKGSNEQIPLTWIIERPNISALSAIITVTTELGIDPSPSSILGFGPLVVDNNVVQYITGGISGVTYRIQADITLVDETIFSGVAYLKIQDPV